MVFQLSPTGAEWVETILYSFCSQTNCADGFIPRSGLVMDQTGNLYGTTGVGGTYTHGTVFKLTPAAGMWNEAVLYNFCSVGNCTDGEAPNSGVIMDGIGNLYGTTTYGGSQNYGTVFELSPTSTGWSQAVLYSFCSQSNCADGSTPWAGLIMDGSGNLYGTTQFGGTGSWGTVFKLEPGPAGWIETVLHTFCIFCADGSIPQAPLLMDAAGNLYGTTIQGGVNSCSGSAGCGVIFELTPTSTGWAESVLHRFCSQANCSDGWGSAAGLLMDPASNLYGTTGLGSSGIGAYGTIFRLASTSAGWSETVLYNFCSQTYCTDGSFPGTGLVMDGSGNLYGTTNFGGNSSGYGASGYGTVFRLTGNGNVLSVAKSGSGSGTVTSSPAGIDCGSACSAAFPPGTQVSLTATPARGSGFTGWGGACSGNGACILTISEDTSVTAAFANTYALSVSAIGSPGGAITSSPSGIDCGATCSATFAAGTQVTLTASPATGWGLAGWGGACSGIASTCAVTMNANTSVSASFTTLFTTVEAPLVGSPTDIPALPAPIIGPNP